MTGTAEVAVIVAYVIRLASVDLADQKRGKPCLPLTRKPQPCNVHGHELPVNRASTGTNNEQCSNGFRCVPDPDLYIKNIISAPNVKLCRDTISVSVNPRVRRITGMLGGARAKLVYAEGHRSTLCFS